MKIAVEAEDLRRVLEDARHTIRGRLRLGTPEALHPGTDDGAVAFFRVLDAFANRPRFPVDADRPISGTGLVGWPYGWPLRDEKEEESREEAKAGRE